jgi:hypothetical protein
MGLLDDAIREHLDLKRRRGADPTEIERDEREALGPVRRGAERQDEPDAVAEEAAPFDDQEWAEPVNGDGESPRAAEPPPLDTESDQSERRRPDLFDEEADAPLSAAPATRAEPEPPDPSLDEPPERVPPPAEEYLPETEFFSAPEPAAEQSAPPAEPEPAPPAEPEHPADETAEYDVEHALEHEQKGEKGEKGEKKEDVLEETPEFLQDTPDHDRLWFEQKPPRDFDFDG